MALERGSGGARLYFWVPGQPGLQSKFQDSQGYTEKPCFETNKQNKKQKIFKSPYMILPDIVRQYLKHIIYLCILSNYKIISVSSREIILSVIIF